MLETYTTILLSLFPLFLIAGCGAFFRHHRWYERGADNSISWLLVHFFMPLLIFDAIVSNDHIESFSAIYEAAAVGFFVTSSGFILARMYAKKWLSKRNPAIFSIAAGLFNYGFLPIPLIMIFSTREVLATLFLFNIGVEIAVWTVGMYVLYSNAESVEPRMIWKKIFSPPLIAVFLSVVLYSPMKVLYSFHGIHKTIHMLSQSTIPLAFLLLGAMIYEYLPSLSTLKIQKNELIAAAILRMCIFPLGFVCLGFVLPVDQSLKTVLYIQAAMPSAVLPIVFAQRVGYDVDLAVGIVLCTTLLGLFSIPLFFSFIF